MRLWWKLIFLVLIWCGFSNNFGLANIGLGVIVSLVCVSILPSKQHDRPYKFKLLPLISLLGIIAVELIESSLLVAWDVITPKHLSEPKFILIDLACRNDVERTLLANIVSLTPGTLSVDLTDDKSKLKVHVMFAQQQQTVIAFIKQKIEPRVMRIFNYADDK
ncbi:MAG: Na+/H+ antiporter subunit E [Pseudomonadota bacterium]